MGTRAKQKIVIWSISAVIASILIGSGVYGIVTLLSSDSKRVRKIQMVTLVKPPPPPPIKEKPPEQKKEEIKKIEKIETPREKMEDAAEEAPPGKELGLDADGSAGADAFGLMAKKGGRALIGGFGSGSLLRKYAWYTAILQDELRQMVRDLLEKNGGIPDGSLTAYINIRLDEVGNITSFDVYGSSGNSRMDDAVEQALKIARISEPPPTDMPRSMKLKITSKG